MSKNLIVTANNQEFNIDQLARSATSGTIKRIHDTSANENIRKIHDNLQADFSIIDNNMVVTETGKTFTISDSFDVYMKAYEYLHDMIVNQGYSPDDTITITQKNGNEKTRTVYQWACSVVKKYIYEQASGEIYNSTKTVTKPDGTKVQYKTIGYTYIEDLGKNGDIDGMEALDKEYIRMGKYDGIDTYSDYVSYEEMLKKLDLTDRQDLIIKLSMQGLSNIQIADRLHVSKQAITNVKLKIQAEMKLKFPEMVRGFKEYKR